MKTRKKRYVHKKPRKRPLFWSSLIYTTNMTHAFAVGLYLYSFCFACLTITSLVVHTEYNILTNVIDKFAIASIVIYGGYRVWSKINHSLRTALLLPICVVTFIATICIYAYNSNISKPIPLYHSIMHYISSFGHHAIILL
jgi:hypothetical protein